MAESSNMSSEWQYHAKYMRKFKDVYQDGRRWRIWDHESGPRSLLPRETSYETIPRSVIIASGIPLSRTSQDQRGSKGSNHAYPFSKPQAPSDRDAWGVSNPQTPSDRDPWGISNPQAPSARDAWGISNPQAPGDRERRDVSQHFLTSNALYRAQASQHPDPGLATDDTPDLDTDMSEPQPEVQSTQYGANDKLQQPTETQHTGDPYGPLRRPSSQRQGKYSTASDPTTFVLQPRRPPFSTLSSHSTSRNSRQYGNPSTSMRSTTSTESGRAPETLDSSYKVVPKARAFFKLGRVFAMVWSEPSEPSSADTDETESSSLVSEVRYGQFVYSSIRRFVVVREDTHHCLCLAIRTYGGQATTKPGLSPQDHAIIYMINQRPSPLAKETGMTKDPLVVTPAGPGDKLDPLSRIHFAKVYTIEHNMKVRNVGKIGQDHIHRLEAYFLRTMSTNRRESLPTTENTSNTPSGKGKNAQLFEEDTIDAEDDDIHGGSGSGNDTSSGLERETAALTTSSNLSLPLRSSSRKSSPEISDQLQSTRARHSAQMPSTSGAYRASSHSRGEIGTSLRDPASYTPESDP